MLYNIYEYNYDSADFKGRFVGIAHCKDDFIDGDYFIEEIDGIPVGFDESDFLN